MQELLTGLLSKVPSLDFVLQMFGLLVVLGQTYVALTPKQTDDAWFAKLEANPTFGPVFMWLKNFAPIQRANKDVKK